MKKILTLPLGDDDIRGLKIGDIFYLKGTLVTGRDEVYHRVVEEGGLPVIDLKGLANYHAGPIVKQLAVSIEQLANSNEQRTTNLSPSVPQSLSPQVAINNEQLTNRNENWELVSIGPTTSARMEKWAAEFIKKTGIKIMIGKGGMGDLTAQACKTHKAIHCVYPGGCAVLGASQIEKIETVIWQELGMAECMWVLKAAELGPLIVSIDTEGGNLFKDNAAFFKKGYEGLRV